MTEPNRHLLAGFVILAVSVALARAISYWHVSWPVMLAYAVGCYTGWAWARHGRR